MIEYSISNPPLGCVCIAALEGSAVGGLCEQALVRGGGGPDGVVHLLGSEEVVRSGTTGEDVRDQPHHGHPSLSGGPTVVHPERRRKICGH